MLPADFSRLCQIFLFIWTTADVIILQKVNAQQSSGGTTNFNTLDTTYYFYQQSEYPRDCTEVHERCQSSNSSGVYTIKPDGYPESFEVYCDVIDDSVGWTVIQRRIIDGTVSFTRDWNYYKNGFGFLSHEFWIGNERLSYLTNQKNYQLSIEMTLSDGSKVIVSYNNFRISDELSHFKLLNTLQYPGITGQISWCPNYMVYGDCSSCQRSCGDPSTCQNTCTEGQSEGCICPDGFYMDGDACVPERECGCYLQEERTIVPDGGTYVNRDCTRIAACSNRQLTRNELYRCSSDAVCDERSGERRCYCKDGFSGDGVRCISTRPPPTDCMDVYNDVSTSSGIYNIKPTNWTGSEFPVYCNMSNGGGWTVFQRRIDGSVDFFLEWQNYTEGFGNVDGEHWLGKDKIHSLTNQKRYRIRIDLVNRDHGQYYGTYDFFRIENEATLYRMSGLGTYSGNADEHSSADGHFLLTYYRNQPFSTKDRDNDASSYNMASYYGGAWWYKDYYYYYCYYYNLNARYSGYFYVCNLPGSNYLYFSEMKIRPV